MDNTDHDVVPANQTRLMNVLNCYRVTTVIYRLVEVPNSCILSD